MKILAVETATAWQSVAILEGERVLARSDRDAEGSHARWLVPTIDRLLASTHLDLGQLDGLAVSIGPGSFTGLRVGLATMLGFRAVTGLPLAVVPTLEGLAWNLRGTALPICPILKSRTGEVYWALYRWSVEGTLRQLAAERVGPPTLIGRDITEPTLVLGDGWARYAVDIREALADRASLLREGPVEAMRPSAVSIGLAGLERLSRGDVAGLGVAPRYVQRAEAEIKYERRPAGSVTKNQRVIQQGIGRKRTRRPILSILRPS